MDTGDEVILRGYWRRKWGDKFRGRGHSQEGGWVWEIERGWGWGRT